MSFEIVRLSDFSKIIIKLEKSGIVKIISNAQLNNLDKKSSELTYRVIEKIYDISNCEEKKKKMFELDHNNSYENLEMQFCPYDLYNIFNGDEIYNSLIMIIQNIVHDYLHYDNFINLKKTYHAIYDDIKNLFIVDDIAQKILLDGELEEYRYLMPWCKKIEAHEEYLKKYHEKLAKQISDKQKNKQKQNSVGYMISSFIKQYV